MYNASRFLWRGAAVAMIALSLIGAPSAFAQHGPDSDHLLGSGEFGNIELVSVEEVTTTPGLVADVAVSPDGNWAFLANWGEPDCAGPETGGQNTPDAGAWVIDISNLSDPVTVGFIPSHQDTRPGEGMQVVHITTQYFNGDLLVMNNEQCGKNGKGGVSLWDVTDPTKPVKVSEHFGDRGGVVHGDANDIHSAFAWDTGDNAYLVMTDNFETTDVDILDITKPNRPRLIREINLSDEFPQIRQDATIPNLVEVFLHDMVVKNIGTNWIMLLSYWDGGYVQLNVNDPANPTLIGDTDYNNPDPELLESTGIMAPPEGNGHQNEFTMDNQFFIGTDEDFGAHDVDVFQIATGPNAGVYVAGAFGWTKPITELSDGVLNGPTVFGGYGCPAGDVGSIPDPSVLGPLAAGEEAILVLSRGPVGDPTANFAACFFSEKVEAAQNAGYDAVIIANHHSGAGFGAFPDATLCGSKGHDFVVTIPGVCLGHRAFHLLFNTPENYTTYPEAPAIGTLGERVNATGIFNGWGYVHLFSNTPSGGKFAELDTYAIDEAHDGAFAFGSGDLSVHEVATDPQQPEFAYLSYYAGGLRSLEIQCSDPSDETTCELVEVGGYLDEHGNNFWGVEAFVRDGCTYIAGSDRDSGLWLFKRTDSCQ
jgi:hypothetical protein